VQDNRGDRDHQIVFPPGVTAEMVMPDGARTPLGDASVRITEYTVGDLGPQRMPGSLPPSSAYTLAFEASVDEALALGAEMVEFSEPVTHYVDNFVGMPVGAKVPMATYDRNRALWIPEPDGRVVQILGISGGLAQIDITGSGLAADSTELTELGVTPAELETLATSRSIGDVLWRNPLRHFSPHDPNFGSAALSNGGAPSGPGPSGGSMDSGGSGRGGGGLGGGAAGGGGGDPLCGGGSGSGATATGSVIDVERRTFSETLPLAGLPFSL